MDKIRPAYGIGSSH